MAIIPNNNVCLFSCRYNPLWLYFRNPVVSFRLHVFEVCRSHTKTRHSRQDSSGRVINPSQSPLPDNTQQSQQTNIHAPGGIRTHNLSRRAAEDLRLRPRGHWDRPKSKVSLRNSQNLFMLRMAYSVDDITEDPYGYHIACERVLHDHPF